MLNKWKTTSCSTRIERVECSRETDKAVWVLVYPWTLDGGRGTKPPTEGRRMKNSESENYHDTWEDARDFLLRIAESEVLRARDRLQRAHDFVGSVKGLRKPAEPELVSA
jgi:hypothetical protein